MNWDMSQRTRIQTILVTGGCGFLGAQLVHAANDAGLATIVLDEPAREEIEAIPAYVPLIRGDAGDPQAIHSVFSSHSIDAVVHLAGCTSIEASVRDPLSCYLRNVSGTRNLVEACARWGAKLVYASSAAVYGPSLAARIDENSLTAPASPLGRTQLTAEWLISDACDAGALSAISLRNFNIAGADPYMRTGDRDPGTIRLVRKVAQAALGDRSEVELHGDDHPTPDGSCVRDYVHVADAADAYLEALRWLEQGDRHGVFNLGYGRGYSVRQVIETATRLTGQAIDVRTSDRRPADASSSVAAVGRIYSILKWKPRFDDLDTIVGHAIEWERKRRQR